MWSSSKFQRGWVGSTISSPHTWILALAKDTWSTKGFSFMCSASKTNTRIPKLSKNGCIIGKYKDSNLAVVDGLPTMTLVDSIVQYPVQSSGEKWWAQDASQRHSRTHRKEAIYVSATFSITLDLSIQARQFHGISWVSRLPRHALSQMPSRDQQRLQPYLVKTNIDVPPLG